MVLYPMVLGIPHFQKSSFMVPAHVPKVIQQGRLQVGETVAIFGCGGLGLAAAPWPDISIAGFHKWEYPKIDGL